MQEDTIMIAVLAGTTRVGRESFMAAEYVAAYGRKLEGVEIILVDPLQLQLPNDGDNPETRDPGYADITARADAFFIVTPEYNHSIPSSLKRMLDSEFDNYLHKPVALAGVSSGSWGGVRVCEALLPVCHTLGMVNIKPELYFPKIKDIFDDQGQMKSEFVEHYNKSIGKSYQELIWFARLLKTAR